MNPEILKTLTFESDEKIIFEGVKLLITKFEKDGQTKYVRVSCSPEEQLPKDFRVYVSPQQYNLNIIDINSEVYESIIRNNLKQS